MLTLVVLLCLSKVQAVTYTFTLNGTNAFGINEDWQWSLPLFEFIEFPFEADQTQEFAIDLRGIKDPTPDGQITKLGEHTRVRVELDYHHGISGYVECGSSDEDGYCKSASRCNPDLGVHKFKIFNQDVPRNVGIKVSFDGNDDGGCAVAAAFAQWLMIVLVTIGICFCVCILTIILACMGMINCCCMQKKTTTIIRVPPSTAGRHPGTGV